VEYIHARTRAKTLFATHYFELTELAEQLSGVKNYHVSVKETGGGIVFLRKVEPGAADRSYGIEVAKLAGLPNEVIDRAREVLAEPLTYRVDPAVLGPERTGSAAACVPSRTDRRVGVGIRGGHRGGGEKDEHRRTQQADCRTRDQPALHNAPFRHPNSHLDYRVRDYVKRR